jgi:aminoglycoside 2''-phosphotransferase
MTTATSSGASLPYLSHIRAAFPSLRIDRAELVTHNGQYHDLVFAETDQGAIAFRFPRFQDGITRLQRIVPLLRALHGKLPLPVPDPRFVSLTPAEVGHAFIGYPRLPGQPLNQDTIAGLPPGALQNIVSQALSFLRALHALPIAEAFPQLTLSSTVLLDEWHDLFSRIRHHLFPSMRSGARDQVTRHFETFLSDPHITTIQPAIVHGDFGTGNILFDPATARLTGVVDFDHTTPGDPALDYAPLIGDFPVDLVRSLAPEIDQFAARIAFYRGTYLLQEALYGAEHDDPEALHAGLAPFT